MTIDFNIILHFLSSLNQLYKIDLYYALFIVNALCNSNRPRGYVLNYVGKDEGGRGINIDCEAEKKRKCNGGDKE
jgi:hypothetical protein